MPGGPHGFFFPGIHLGVGYGSRKVFSLLGRRERTETLLGLGFLQLMWHHMRSTPFPPNAKA